MSSILGSILGFIFGESADFYLVSASQNGTQGIRVVYNLEPEATDPSVITDALNPNNYYLSGPLANAVTSVTMVDPFTFDLTLDYPLAVGYWTTVVGNVASGIYIIGTPHSWTFLVASAFTAPSVTGGATNSSTFNLLRKFLNPTLAGANWDALIRAMSVGMAVNQENSKLAYNQLYICTASEKYLVQRAADQGIAYPENVGLTDQNFRQLAISIKNRQVTEESFLEVLEIYYGKDSVRGNASSGAEPFDLDADDDLIILIDESTEIQVVFQDTDFGITSQATAIEVAAAITRAFRVNSNPGYAVAETDPLTGDTVCKIYSGGLGLGSTVRITGGKAQNVLNFPTFLDIYTGDPFPEWDIQLQSSGNLRYTLTTPDLNPDFTQLRVGDYVNIFGDEFATDNLGSFPIVELSLSYDFTDPPVLNAYFEVYNLEGFDQAVVQLAEDSMRFYRPTKNTTFYSEHRYVAVADLGSYVDVVLPTTSTAVSRSKYRAAYLHTPVTLEGTQLEGNDGVVTITAAAHGLSVGDWIEIDGFVANFATPAVTTNGAGIADSSVMSVWTEAQMAEGNRYGGIAATMYDDSVYSGLGVSIAAGVPTFLDTGEKTVLALTESNGEIVVTYTETAAPAYDAASGFYRNGITALSESMGADLLYGPSVLISGGIYSTGSQYECSGNAFVYKSITNTYDGPIAMSIPQALHSSNLTEIAAAPAILLAGGMRNYAISLDDAQYWDGAFALATSMNVARAEHCAVTLSDNTILVSGGRPLAAGPILDVSTTGLWRLSDSAAAPQDESTNAINLTGTATAFLSSANPNSYRAIDFNGTTSKLVATQPACQPVIDLLTTKTYTIECWANMQTNTTSSFVNLAGNTFISYTGFSLGADYDATDNLLFYYDDVTNTRRKILSTVDILTLPNYWNHFAATVEPYGVSNVTIKLYVNGRLVFTSTNQTRPVGEATMNLSIGYIRDGADFFYDGAISQVKISDKTLSATEIWDSYVSGTGLPLWQEADDLPTERCGKALISCEIYDPGTDTWAMTGTMTQARFNHKLVVLPDGTVLAAGGHGYNPTRPNRYDGTAGTFNCLPLKSVEIWSPTEGRWRSIGSLQYNEGELCAEYVESMGGVVFSNGNTTQTELYNPTTGKFSVIGPTNSAITGSKSVLSQGILTTWGGRTYLGDTSDDSLQIFVPNSNSYFNGSMNDFFKVSGVVDTDTFTVENAQVQYLFGDTAFTIMKAGAVADSTIPGPYLLDPQAGLAITDVSSTTVTELAKGHRYNSVTIADGTDFEESGYLVFGFGTKDQVGPVQYLSKLSANVLALDNRFTFTKDVPIGATCIRLYQKEPYSPRSSIDLGVFWLTDSPSGRLSAQRTIRDIQSATSEVNISVIFPGPRGVGGENFGTSGYKVNDIVPAFGGVE